MRDEIVHATPDATDAYAHGGIQLHHRDFLADAANLPDGSIDLIVADPPYGLGKDYGNDSDMRSGDAFLDWTYGWLEIAPDGTFTYHADETNQAVAALAAGDTVRMSARPDKLHWFDAGSGKRSAE